MASRVRYGQVFDQTRLLPPEKQINKTFCRRTDIIINRNVLLSLHDNKDSLPPPETRAQDLEKQTTSIFFHQVKNKKGALELWHTCASYEEDPTSRRLSSRLCPLWNSNDNKVHHIAIAMLLDH
ncbi:hypothetical protein DY000_02021528 [Brassica cretica]|uniref:Uncharacterized protein n=1 Tax=Brassica cretica TaxID=69181 RepID=A0ABQ7E502_BRACR|nr:hypothetical protein DY000_02021528 [Brassica cretica]